MLLLDTNIYLDADRDSDFAARLGDQLARLTEPIGLSSVVLAELLIGVRSAGERSRLLAATVDVTPPAHVLTPTAQDWRVAGDALHRLGFEASTRGRSFWNDLLLAASCASAGATLLTRNVSDFRRIRRVIPVAVMASPS